MDGIVRHPTPAVQHLSFREIVICGNSGTCSRASFTMKVKLGKVSGQQFLFPHSAVPYQGKTTCTEQCCYSMSAQK